MEPPDDFICPITQDIMVNPVTCALGHSFELVKMEHWLATHDTSPKTNTRLPSKILTWNHALRNVIEEWVRIGDQKNIVKL
jgi:hypothetical protein